MLTYIFFAFENIFYGIVFDLEISGKLIKLYQAQAQLLFSEMLGSTTDIHLGADNKIKY